MINQYNYPSIYTDNNKSILETIDSAIDDLKKPIESNTLFKTRLFAGFLLCKIKLSAPQSFASSLVVNLIINDVLHIRQLVQKKHVCNENLKHFSSLNDCGFYAGYPYGKTPDEKGDGTKMSAIAINFNAHFKNARSQISKELMFRVIGIASLCLIMGGMIALSKPLMIAGSVVYLVTRLFISRLTNPNSSKDEKDLHDNIIVMKTIIDLKKPQVHPQEYVPVYQQTQQQAVHPYQVFPGNQQQQFMPLPQDLQTVYRSINI